MGNKFIHLGYSKCASTLLQKIIFPKHPDIYLYSKNLSGADNKFPGRSRELTQSLINLENFSGFPDGCEEDLIKSMENHEGKTFVWSNEHFCESTAPMFLAQQLKQLIPDARILLIIRKQIDIVKSMYHFKGYNLEFAPEPYIYKHVSFENWIKYNFKNLRNKGGHKARDWSGNYLQIINYNHYISIFEKIFGKENMLIIPFEKLTNSYNLVYQAMGLPEQKLEIKHSVNSSSDSSFVHNILSRVNLKQGVGTGLSKLFPKTKYTPKTTERLFKHYQKGNEALDKRYKLSLKELGYY